MKSRFNKTDEISRRNFMGKIAKTCLGVSVAPTMLNAASPTFGDMGSIERVAGVGTARSVIYLYMGGGMSHVDTLDPKEGNIPVAGNVKSIKTTADNVLLSEFMPNLAKQMHHVCLFRGMYSSQGAHQQGRYFLHTSYAKRGTITHPEMGSWILKLGGKLNPHTTGKCKNWWRE